MADAQQTQQQAQPQGRRPRGPRPPFLGESRITEAWEWIQTWLAPWIPVLWEVSRGHNHEAKQAVKEALRKHFGAEIKLATPVDAEYMIMLRNAVNRAHCPDNWATKCKETMEFFSGHGTGTGEDAPLTKDELSDLIQSLAVLVEGVRDDDAEQIKKRREVGRDLLYLIIMADTNAERRAVMRAATLIKMDPKDYKTLPLSEKVRRVARNFRRTLRTRRRAAFHWVNEHTIQGAVDLGNDLNNAAGKLSDWLEQRAQQRAANPPAPPTPPPLNRWQRIWRRIWS